MYVSVVFEARDLHYIAALRAAAAAAIGIAQSPSPAYVVNSRATGGYFGRYSSRYRVLRFCAAALI